MVPENLEGWLALGLSNAILATALALLAFAVSRLYRRPPVAHALWLLVLLKLLSPPLLEIPASRLEELRSLAARLAPAVEATFAPAPAPPIEPSVTVAELTETSFDEAVAQELVAGEFAQTQEPVALSRPASPLSWIATAALLAWLGGALLVLTAAVVRIIRFDRLLRWSRPAPGPLALAVSEVARQMGLSAAPRSFVVEARIPPLLWTWRGETRIIFPAGLLALLGEAQLRTLVAHELAHLRRRDHWLRWLELLAVALYWWLPVAWWARKELRRAEEECCDAWVQHQLAASVRDYARALLKTIDFLSGVPVKLPRTASTLGEARFLRRRFQMILERSPHHRLSAPLRALWIAAGLAVLPWAASGALGQKAEEAPSEDAAPKAAEVKSEAPPIVVEGGVDVEQRLSRLERQLAEMMAEIRLLRGKSDGEKKSPLRVVDGAIESLDPASGKVRWRTELKGSPDAELLRQGNRVVVTDTVKRQAVVLDADTGKVISKDRAVAELRSRDPDDPIEKAETVLRVERKRANDEELAWERSQDLESANALRHHKDALHAKADAERTDALRAKLKAQLGELEAQRAAIKEQLKKLEPRFEYKIAQ